MVGDSVVGGSVVGGSVVGGSVVGGTVVEGAVCSTLPMQPHSPKSNAAIHNAAIIRFIVLILSGSVFFLEREVLAFPLIFIIAQIKTKRK